MQFALSVPVWLHEKSVKIMSKTPFEKLTLDDELLAEYHFDYEKAKSNRFAVDKKRLKIVILDQNKEDPSAAPESKI